MFKSKLTEERVEEIIRKIVRDQNARFLHPDPFVEQMKRDAFELRVANDKREREARIQAERAKRQRETREQAIALACKVCCSGDDVIGLAVKIEAYLKGASHGN